MGCYADFVSQWGDLSPVTILAALNQRFTLIPLILFPVAVKLSIIILMFLLGSVAKSSFNGVGSVSPDSLLQDEYRFRL